MLLNQETSYRTSKSPFGIRLGDRLSGRPLHVDISDEPMANGTVQNRNKVVIGGSGSGKSMFMNHMLHSYVQQGAHCVVVDVGHSYQGLCDLVGGYYFTYSEETPIRFNLFISRKETSWIPKRKSRSKRCCWRFGSAKERSSAAASMWLSPMRSLCTISTWTRPGSISRL